MRRVSFWSMVLGCVVIAASCGGRATLESYELESETGSTGTGAGGASSSSSTTNATNSTIASTVVSVSCSSTGGLECEQGNDCSDCVNCSIENSCNGAVVDCFSDADCSAFNDCLQICNNTEDCFDQCIAMHPSGWELYQDVLVCLFCDACPNVCVEQNQDICAP